MIMARCGLNTGKGGENGLGVSIRRGVAMRQAALMADAFAKASGNAWMVNQECPRRCNELLLGRVQLVGRVAWQTFRVGPLWVAVAARFWQATVICAPDRKNGTA
jgi:hypothetical protein